MNAETFLEHFDSNVVILKKIEKTMPRYSCNEMVEFAERFNEMKVKQIEIDNQQLCKTKNQLTKYLRR